MQEIIALIGGASGKELTEGIQNRGFQVALIAGRNGELGTDIADYVITTDLRNTDTIYSFLQDWGIKYILVGTGHRFAFSLARELEKNGIISNINTEASNLAKEKRLFKDFISSKGFSTPEYVSIQDRESMPSIESIEKALSYPCVVKATIDTMYPQKVFNRTELMDSIQTVLDSGSPVVVEEFVRGIDITVFVSVSNGIAKALPICYYSKAEDNDMKGFTDDEYLKERLSEESEQKVKEYCERLALECGFEGLPRVDLMAFPDGTVYILEVNSVGVTGVCDRHEAYCKGTVLALREQGIDVAGIAIDTALRKFQLA